MSEITTVFEDHNLLAIHKPENICFHTEEKKSHVDTGIVELIRQRYSGRDLYPVHRLDKLTSGLLLFAKGKTFASLLSQKFQDRDIEKYYLAVSSNKPKKKQGSIIGDMEKGRNGCYLLRKTSINPAISRFKSLSLRNLETDIVRSEEANWLHLIKIESGKTHQIRVALKSLGCPVLGDGRYGCGGADRGYLHAFKVRFSLEGRLYEITDNNFVGDHLTLSAKTLSAINESWLYPETLAWPKGSSFI